MICRQVGISCISLGMAIAFANLLPQETYGAYKYVISISLLLAITTLSGINTSLTRSVAKGYEGSIVPALVTRMRWGIIGSILALFIVLYYQIQGNSLLVSIFLIVAVFLPFKSSFSVYQAYWQGKQRFDIFAKFAILQECVIAMILVVTIWLSDDLFVLVLVFFASQTSASAFFYVLTRSRLSNERRDPETIPYGKHVSFSGALFSIANNATDVVIWHLLGPASVAVFAFAQRPPQEIRRLFTEAFPIALPKFTQQSKEAIQQTLIPKIAKLYLLIIPCVVGYLLLAPSVFEWIFPAYLESVYYSQWLSLSILVAPLSLFGTVFQALGRTKEIYINSILAPLLLVPALVLFVWFYGLFGVIIAWLVTQMIGASITIYLFKRM
ncbi:MAG: Polysaccharide biosynthesis protein [Candidatus Uhrbacteria bacterium GW2011_GWA2_52_8d]|uniref:Polysaccharide biosynthesis protein n=1 Tax=Candidatus Uhrbacteria bacterium GW2011_GWA2_52_8d TaxID=1618979 RepID=A0A0G1XN58_9BACT|nr:MAG: Polysaccharide biosynthesis protein [Candidatus Uhrbacteria bacterium GW2011_GWA2_52_8d]